MDCSDQSGRPPRPLSDGLLRPGMAFLRVLRGFFSCLTVSPCGVHDSCCLKPTWQRAILGIRLEFRGAHAVEKIVETYLLTAINPLTSRIDLAIRLNCGNNRTCG